jgi:hypothetical protein
MEKAIEDLLQKGAVTQVQPKADQFISTLFLVEKESGSEQFRPVINLRPLNRFVRTESFRMEGLQIAKNLIQPGDFLMKLDLKDAYYTVPVHKEHRRYLCFSYQGTLYEFCCLPFGLSSAPRAFTKLLKPVATLLRSMGIRVVIYLDDILLLHQDKEELRNLFNKVLELLQNLGFTINREKCSSAPTQSLVFLGGLLNSVNMTISLPSEKLNAITKAAQEMQKDQEVTEKVLSSFLGRLSHAAQTGVWTAPLHYRSIQQQHVNMARQVSRWPTAARVSLSQRSIQELTWWQSAEVQTFNGQPLQLPAFDMTISTDASLLGWGATWPGTTIGGRWLPTEAKGHINLLELKAAHLALQAFFRTYTPTPRHILLQMDNSTAVAYVNKRGGTRSYSLSTEALKLWALVLQAGCWITARHIPGTTNTIADLASRQFHSYAEWTLNQDVFRQITQRFYRPEVDLFATRANHRLPRYVSRYPDPGAMATDAFLCDWGQWRSWVYAPLVLMPRIVQKIKRDEATALILAPFWKGQPWFPSLLELLVDYPRQLPQIPHLITLPFQPEREHPLQHSLRLTVWPVSGNATAQTDFRRRLQMFYCRPGVNPHGNVTLGHGTLGLAGVVHGLSVPLQPL